jgi:hypothetical protein
MASQSSNKGKRKVKRNPVGVVMLKHAREDAWNKHVYLGGRNCARLTIPCVTVDQINDAGLILEALGHELKRIAREPGSVAGKVFEARWLITRAHAALKGGATAYKGAR